MASIKREAQSVDFGLAAGSRGPRDNTSYVGVDQDAERGSLGRLSTASAVQSSSLDTFVGQLGQAMQIYGNRQMKFEGEKQYLAGAADAMAGKSKDEVETNIFTRAWKDEGFADTRGRLGVADAEAQLATDMVKLREQDPTKMKEYLTTRREGLLGLMDGMSMEARKGMMAQMVLSERAALVKHQGEYSKFVIDQQGTAIQTNFSVLNGAMNASKDNPDAYDKAVDSAMGGIWANVVQNPNLPKANKQQLISDAARLSLSNDNQKLYEKMRDVRDPQGVSLLDQLPHDEQIKLSNAYQDSRARTAALRNSGSIEQLALYESKLGNPKSEPTPWTEHQAIVQQGIKNGTLTEARAGSLTKAWQDAENKRSTRNVGASNYATGNVNALFRDGKTEEEGLEDFVVSAQMQGKTPAQTAASLAMVGTATGQLSAFKGVGKLMNSSIQAITNPSGNIDQGQLEGVNAVIRTIETFDAKGDKGARTAFLSAFDDDTKAKLLTYMDGLKAHGNPAVAASDAAKRSTENALLSKADKDAIAGNQAKENTAIMEQLTPKGMWATLYDKVVPSAFRSDQNVAIDKLRASEGIFDSKRAAEEAMASGRVAYMEEVNEVSRQYPFMSAKRRSEMALTKLADRTIQTEGSYLILPQGQTVQSFFGVPASVNADIVSSTLNEYHKPKDGNRIRYSATADGRMRWSEVDGSGAEVNVGVLNPKTLAGAVQKEQDKLTSRFAATDGSGVFAKGQDGSQVQYNGTNTIGIGSRVMLQYRNDLVKYEDIRSKPYDDASGKLDKNGKRIQTVGVGVSSHNPFYPPVQPDGTVKPEDINRSFELASDAAMKTGNAAMQGLPESMRKPYATRLFGQLAYQGGSVPNGRYTDSEGKKQYDESRDLVKQMQVSREAAFAALKKSPQYKMAHTARKQFYEHLLDGVVPN